MIDIQTIQRFALHAVEKNGWEYQYRKICRWYSRTYATPLTVVEMDLLPEDVLQHYFEETIERLKGAAEDLDAKAEIVERWTNFRDMIINGFEATKEAQEQMEAEDDNWAADLAKILAEEEKAAKAKKKPIVKAPQEDPNLYDADTLFGKEMVADTPPDY